MQKILQKDKTLKDNVKLSKARGKIKSNSLIGTKITSAWVEHTSSLLVLCQFYNICIKDVSWSNIFCSSWDIFSSTIFFSNPWSWQAISYPYSVQFFVSDFELWLCLQCCSNSLLSTKCIFWKMNILPNVFHYL